MSSNPVPPPAGPATPTSLAQTSLAQTSLADYLQQLADRTPAPGGGSAAAVTLALAAALCAMAARISEIRLPAAGEIAARADAVRLRALALAELDGVAYGAVLAARKLSPETDAAERQQEMAKAMTQAIAVPQEVADLGAEVALLAADVAAGGKQSLLGDALAAVVLAESANAVAARLVKINLSE